MKSVRQYQAAVLSAFLSLIAQPVNAQDICSSEGKSKMRSANVSEIQVTEICPATTSQPEPTTVDFEDVDSLIFDIPKAKGKTIQLTGRFRGLTTEVDRPAMSFIDDTGTSLKSWTVSFGNRFNSTVTQLQSGQRLSIICIIREVRTYGSSCELQKLSPQ